MPQVSRKSARTTRIQYRGGFHRGRAEHERSWSGSSCGAGDASAPLHTEPATQRVLLKWSKESKHEAHGSSPIRSLSADPESLEEAEHVASPRVSTDHADCVQMRKCSDMWSSIESPDRCLPYQQRCEPMRKNSHGNSHNAVRESAATGKSDAALSVAPPGLEPGLS
jgi:hypothetical protein